MKQNPGNSQAFNFPKDKYQIGHQTTHDNVGANLETRLFRPEALIWLISNAAVSLETLSIDPHTFESEHVLECLRLAVRVNDLTFGNKLLFNPDLEEDIRYHDLFDLEAFTVPTTGYGSASTSNMPFQNEFLLPNLESLEVNDGYIIGDEKIGRILTSRVEAAQRGMTSPPLACQNPVQGRTRRILYRKLLLVREMRVW